MTRLVDVKEIGLEVPGIQRYSISRQRGSVGLNFNFVAADVNRDYAIGDSVLFKGVNGVVTSKQFNAGQMGYETVYAGVSKIGELIRKAPVKTLQYMSMTSDEIEEFQIAIEDSTEELDYIPLIKQCDPKTGTGGWCSRDVIADLFEKAGIDYRLNVYNYWLKQVVASNASSYFDTVISLVQFLRPIIYSDESTVYIIERPWRSGSVEFSKIAQASERHTLNYESKAKYFRVTGGLGVWDASKASVPTQPERETELVSETSCETPMFMTVNMRGDKEVINKMTGEKQVVGADPEHPYDATISLGVWLKEPMRERHKVSEVWRLDCYGNFKAMISRHKVSYNTTLGVTTLDCLEEYEYDFLGEDFDRPRPSKIVTTNGKWVWQVGGQGLSFRMFRGGVEEINQTYVYAPNGTLLEEVMTRAMDVVRLAIGNEFVELDLADSMWIPEGGDDLLIERQVVEERVSKYRQMTPDLYQKTTTIRRLGALARVPGQESYSVSNEIIRGRVPRSPMRYKRMIVWADNLPHDSIPRTEEVPVVSVSNPNIIDWGDAEAILRRIMQLATESNVVERTLTIPKDIEIDVGWQMFMPSIELAGGVEIPEFSAPNYSYVTSWTKSKDARTPNVTTTVVVEGR
jgi:hypothetical protein